MKNKKRKAKKVLLTVNLSDYADKNIVSICRPGNNVASIYESICKKDLIVDSFIGMRQAVANSYSSEILKASSCISGLALQNQNIISSIVAQSSEMRQAIASYSSEMINASNHISESALCNYNAVSSIASQAFGITKSISELVTKESLGFQSMTVLGSEMREAINRTVSLFHDSMRESCFSSVGILNDAVFAIPTTLITRKIDNYSMVSLSVDDRKTCIRNNEYQITAITTEENDCGLLTYKTVQETQLRVVAVENKLECYEKIFGERETILSEKLDEMLQFFRDCGGQVFRVKNIEYNKKTCELRINHRVVPFDLGTLENDICRILFRSKSSMKRQWELEDLVTAIGEYMGSCNWENKIYDAVRRINDQIERKTGLAKFIVWVKKVIMVDPHLISYI